MATCPYCGHDNQPWEFETEDPGERPPTVPILCEHYVYTPTSEATAGADYVNQFFYLDVYNEPNRTGKFGTQISADVLDILTKHLRFVDGMAFAASKAKQEAAHREVAVYLHSLGFEVPDRP